MTDEHRMEFRLRLDRLMAKVRENESYVCAASEGYQFANRRADDSAEELKEEYDTFVKWCVENLV